MKKFKGIVLHCSASDWGTARDIDKWHRERGFSRIGYHFVIMNGMLSPIRYMEVLDGQIERGRGLESENAAHALGFNRTHIGICSISNGKYTEKQAEALFDLVVELQEYYKIEVEDILGHNEVSAKSCPCFDVEQLREAILYQDREMFLEYMREKDVPEKPKVQEIKYVPLTKAERGVKDGV